MKSLSPGHRTSRSPSHHFVCRLNEFITKATYVECGSCGLRDDQSGLAQPLAAHSLSPPSASAAASRLDPPHGAPSA